MILVVNKPGCYSVQLETLVLDHPGRVTLKTEELFCCLPP